MKCKKCQKKGLKSTIELGLLTSTLMGWSTGYYNDDGNWVDNEDPNIYFQEYKCSNGHIWEEKLKDKFEK